MGDVLKNPSAASSVRLVKRKRSHNLVLQLSGGSTYATSESETDAASTFSSNAPLASSSKITRSTAPIIFDGKLLEDDKKIYYCGFEGCVKAYKKPSRLAEHERSHTGDRPFICAVCQKTYFRESHLQAHARTHLPDSARTFTCSRKGCEKRFWTFQHMKRHEEMHSGDKPFKCTEEGCEFSFSKHNQLRAHTATSHCPPGTKPFRCEHKGCDKSFSTSQKLRSHVKTHEVRRYTCSHLSCVKLEPPEFFNNWSSLQAHNRSAHPATCPYRSCDGKTFTQQKGLRAHLKIHEQQEIEEALQVHVCDNSGDADDEDECRKKRRRGGEVGRDWKCNEDGCEKDFKSKKALTTHFNVTHLKRRDFKCTMEDCGSTFGYKHLLQRHIARFHSSAETIDIDSGSINGDEDTSPFTGSIISGTAKPSAIDILTGKAYSDNSKERLANNKALRCPVNFSFCTPARTAGDCNHEDAENLIQLARRVDRIAPAMVGA